MRKGISFLWLVLLCTSAIAQKGFDLGVSGTFNSTWVLNQNNYGTLAPFANAQIRASEMNYKPTWGGNGGITLGYNITRNWGVRMELQYNATGQKYEDNFEGPATIPEGTFGSPSVRVDVKRNISLSYIQIPIMAKFMTNKGNVAKFFVCLGPQFGIRTAASETVWVANYVYIDTASNFPPSQKFRSFDFGMALQLGVDIFATDHLYFEAGMSAYGGITDINGAVLRNLGWYSHNDVEYQVSHNFRGGLMIGIHYIFGEGRER